jgi:multidrug efflux pump subunit AcrA (membrane-fusion protein)
VNLDKSKTLYTSLAQLEDNEADKSFVPSKAAASAVTSAQQAFEAAKTADVAARNAANTAEADALKEKVRAARTLQASGEQVHNPFPSVPGYYKNVFIPEEDMYLSIETPVESYAAKAESLANAKATAMKQLYTMDAW